MTVKRAVTKKPVIVLLALAIGAPLLAFLPTGQDPETTDWAAAVKNACTSRRYGIRLAAARNIAAGGEPAIRAVVAWTEANGRNALPDTLAEKIAKAKTTDAAVVEVLWSWATDREFYWRSYAFLGLANRAPDLPDDRDRLTDLFVKHRDDPAWLVRVHARFGLHLLSVDPVVLGNVYASPDDDPRIASKLSGLLLESGVNAPLQPLLDALADERTFLGVPWGALRAKEAHQLLRQALGDAHPMANGEPIEDKIAAVTAIRDAMQKEWAPAPLQIPAIATDPEVPFVGGFEVQSCRNGDVHLQWTGDGRIYTGIDGRFLVQLPASTWDALQQERTELQLEPAHGVLICDNIRLQWDAPAVHSRVAPAAMPAPTKEWLGRLASALADADKPDLAAALREAIDQFGSR